MVIYRNNLLIISFISVVVITSSFLSLMLAIVIVQGSEWLRLGAAFSALGMLAVLGLFFALYRFSRARRMQLGAKSALRLSGLLFWLWFVGFSAVTVSIGLFAIWVLITLLGAIHIVMALNAGIFAALIMSLTGMIHRVSLLRLSLNWHTFHLLKSPSPNLSTLMLTLFIENRSLRASETHEARIDAHQIQEITNRSSQRKYENQLAPDVQRQFTIRNGIKRELLARAVTFPLISIPTAIVALLLSLILTPWINVQRTLYYQDLNGAAVSAQQTSTIPVPSDTPQPETATPGEVTETQSADIATPTAETGTPSADMGTPTAETGTPGSDMATPTANTGTPSADMGTPTAETETPLADIGTSTPETGTPSADMGTPTAETGTPGSDMRTPTANTGTPSVDMGTPTANTGTPSADMGTPTAEPGTPSADMGTPTAETGTPGSDMATPTANTGTPSVGIGTPTAETGTPSTDMDTPTAETGSPSSDMGTPTASTGTPSPGPGLVASTGTPTIGAGTPSPGPGLAASTGTPTIGAGTPSPGPGSATVETGTSDGSGNGISTPFGTSTPPQLASTVPTLVLPRNAQGIITLEVPPLTTLITPAGTGTSMIHITPQNPDSTANPPTLQGSIITPQAVATPSLPIQLLPNWIRALFNSLGE